MERKIPKLLPLAVFFCVSALGACQSVKPYQTQYLQDYYMQTGPLPVEKSEMESEGYREGGTGGTGGKTGGGCGCY